MNGGRAFGTIIQIGDILVSEDVVFEHFACDWPVCRGACCVEGDSGAPLREEEPEQLERAWAAFSPLLTAPGRAAVASKGFFEIDRDGDLVTPLVEGSRECAYSITAESEGLSLESSAAGSPDAAPTPGRICAIEKCFLAGRCSFRKPLSCSLYPIRVTHLTGGGLALNVHHWDICRSAFEKGRREGIRVYQFLREPLVEAFGAEFYQALSAAADHLLGQPRTDTWDQN